MNAYFAFIVVSVAVIVIPGPSILLVVANSLQQGLRAGFLTVAGTSAAMAVQLTVALVGLTSLAALLARGLGVIRWLGIVYLAWLGIARWRSATTVDRSPARRGHSAFAEGFLVSLMNPTTMLFFVAFFPQFLDDVQPAATQLLRMAVTFWVLALAFDLTCAGLAARLGQALRDPRRAAIRNRVSGAILLAAALALALARV